MTQCAKCGAQLEQAGDRFCSNCGAAQSEIAPIAPGPTLGLQINANRLLMQDNASVLEFRVHNLGDQPLAAATLEVAGKFLGPVDPDVVDEPIRPGATWPASVEFNPAVAGVHRVRVSITCQATAPPDGAARPFGCVYRGQLQIKVLRRPRGPEKIVFDRSLRAEAGAKVGYGLSIQSTNDDSKVLGQVLDRWDENSQLTADLPEQWRDIPLHKATSLPPPAAPAAPPAGVRLEKAALLLPDGARPRCVLVISRAEVSFGRRRDGNQVVLRLFPNAAPRSGQPGDDRSVEAENWRRSQKVSRDHFSLQLRADGLFLRNLKSTNETALNGKPVRGVSGQSDDLPAEVRVPLDRTSEVEVAGVLRLRLVPFLDDGTLPAERLAGLPNLPGPGELWELAERSRLPALRSLLVQRVNNLADAESYLLVYRWARVGGDQPSEIPLPESCNEPPCLRIVRLGGQFWLESLTGRDCLTVDGIAMRKGQFWPLKPSAALGCARCGFQFAPFAQHGL